MEERVGPLTFFSNFDSGNLAKVERVKVDEDVVVEEALNVPPYAIPDYDYNAWTWPDAVGTENENLNRTWFHFGVKGGSPGKLLKVKVMNMNRQGKLYNQGMSPFVRVVPGRNKWERIRDRPTFETVEGQFRLSFTYRFPDQRNSVHYFAFCYPYSYSELQSHLATLDQIYSPCKQMTPDTPSTRIYYYRELLCKTLDYLRLDLLTITSCKAMTDERETRLDKLFPDADAPRPHRFKGKKVYFLSARVHPGETPSSFVFNGFLDFILRRDDPRAMLLRDRYVFKLIPMLNPDGVKRGHYRTDCRGVNLNRVYLEPDPVLHPTIYAAKSVVMYHHGKAEPAEAKVCKCRLQKTSSEVNNNNKSDCRKDVDIVVDILDDLSLSHDLNNKNTDIRELGERLPPEGMESLEEAGCVQIPDDEMTVVSADLLDFGCNKSEVKISKIEEKITMSNTTETSNTADNLTNQSANGHGTEAPDVSGNIDVCKCFNEAEDNKQSSSLEYYVDLHGHASKRGCFVYANYLENEDGYVQSILYPKLMSINSANFDFTGCNFTEKNMYAKDKRDGMSKEGSGRVAIFKATSIVHSYTLECNYNGGRMLNPVPPATCDNGRATPPPPPGFPPKFTTEIYEEIGRALAISVLDMRNSNPWSRLPTSEFGSSEGVRNWVRRYIKSAKNAPAIPKKLSRIAAKTSSLVAGATASTRQKISSTFKSTSSGDLSSDTLSAAAQKVTERMTHNFNAMKKGLDEPKPLKRIHSLAVPRRLSHPMSTATIKPAANYSRVYAGLNGSLQMQKSKEQLRVSLELPKTGPSLRIPKPNQLLAANIKALSCPADLRIGRTNQVEMKNQYIGLQSRQATLEQAAGTISDEEKRKKGVILKKRSGKRKGKQLENVVSIAGGGKTNGHPPTRNCEEDMKLKQRKSSDTCSGKGGSNITLLHRSNSKNKIMINNDIANACDVVDITELPQSGSQSMGYWVELHDLSTISHTLT